MIRVNYLGKTIGWCPVEAGHLFDTYFQERKILKLGIDFKLLLVYSNYS